MPRRHHAPPYEGMSPVTIDRLLAQLRRDWDDTRRSRRMYQANGATVPTRTRTTVHDPTARRTQPNTDGPTGRGVRIAAVDPTGPSAGSDLSLPGGGTPSRARARGAERGER